MTEGYEVEKDLTSMIEPEVTKFNTYINQNKAKSLVTDLKIAAEYAVKNTLSKIGGEKATEKYANAYTVLCKKMDKQALKYSELAWQYAAILICTPPVW